MFIYLQQTKIMDGKHVPTENLRFRGKAGDGDDPESYRQLMESRGLRVHIAPEYLGRLIGPNLETLEN
jgi:hypothetical protein